MAKGGRTKHFKRLHNSSEIAPPAKERKHKKMSFSINWDEQRARTEVLTDAG